MVVLFFYIYFSTMLADTSIITPQNDTVSFKIVRGANAKDILKSQPKELPESYPVTDLLRRKAYLLSSGEVLQVLHPDLNVCLLFKDQGDYVKANRGREYFETGIIVDGNNNVYYSFSLINGITYYSNSIKKLDKFREYEGYNAYLLPGGRVCFLRKLTESRYQGYWFADMLNFEYFYENFAQDE